MSRLGGSSTIFYRYRTNPSPWPEFFGVLEDDTTRPNRPKPNRPRPEETKPESLIAEAGGFLGEGTARPLPTSQETGGGQGAL